MVLDWKGILAIGVVAGVGIYLAKKQLASAAAAVGTAVNPLSDQNVAYQASNAVTQAVTGNSTDTLGTALYALFNPGSS